jgi:large subunit ribosomal protein L13
MPTYIPKIDDAQRKWFLIDAKDVVLGKVATKASVLLSGKSKPVYTPFLDTGDHVVIVNASSVHLTGKKDEGKLYRRHSGYLGGLKTATAAEVRAKQPARILEEAIRGMLPKTKLGRAMAKKLRVYAGATHPHQAQKPQPIAIR